MILYNFSPRKYIIRCIFATLHFDHQNILLDYDSTIIPLLVLQSGMWYFSCSRSRMECENAGRRGWLREKYRKPKQEIGRGHHIPQLRNGWWNHLTKFHVTSSNRHSLSVAFNREGPLFMNCTKGNLNNLFEFDLFASII